ncbi:hypothetical protein TrLO_g6537 [Triparma laevis f. longispina]|uniref:Protein kinase domain-containing protein n=1 Tax=Triparma laevis f. longispina TaxID=1714387 RepID=A0A9W6ZXR0_9STRA|nr:hypothetical protein TrLO_g6537 [Triparma laevis f. longispina]
MPARRPLKRKPQAARPRIARTPWDSRFIREKLGDGDNKSVQTKSSYRSRPHNFSKPIASGSAPSRDQRQGAGGSDEKHSLTSPEITRDNRAKEIYRKKMDAARAVGYRESLLMQLNAVVLHWPKKEVKDQSKKVGSSLPEAARLLRNMSVDLREAGLRCVEKIVSWVLTVSINATSPTPFLWNGSDYLLKMYTDLNFVRKGIGPQATKIANFCDGNPLLLSSDEIKGKGTKSQVGRAHAASIVILDVVRRNRKRAKDGMEGTEVEKKVVRIVEKKVSPKKKEVSPMKVEPEDEFEAKEEVVEEKEEEEEYEEEVVEEEKKEEVVVEEKKSEKESKEEEEEEEEEESYGSDDYDDFEEEESKSQAAVQQQSPPTKSTNQSDNQSPEKEDMIEAIVLSESPRTEVDDDMLDNYDFGKLLGEGAYGYVYLAHHKPTRKKVAVKKFKAASEEDEDVDYVIKTQEREVDICTKLKHPHVVEVIDHFVQDGTQYISFEMMECNVLEIIERNEGGLPDMKIVKLLMKQLLEGLSYVHSMNVVHRDIKPENLLIINSTSDKPTLRLCDFGAARFLNEGGDDKRGGLTHYVGSRWYRAPELLGNSDKESYGCAVDVWSAACIMAEITTGNALFQGDDENEVVEYILDILGPLSMESLRNLREQGVMGDVYKAQRRVKSRDLKVELKKLGKNGVALIEEMLSVEVRGRPTASVCLDRAYFATEEAEGVDEEKEEEEEEDNYDDDEEYEDDDEDFEEEEEEKKEEEKEGKDGLTAESEVWGMLRDRDVEAALKSILLKGEPANSTDLSDCLGDVRSTNFQNFCTEVVVYASSDQLFDLVTALHSVIDLTTNPILNATKTWMLSQQRSDMSLQEVVDEVSKNNKKVTTGSVKAAVEALGWLASSTEMNTEVDHAGKIIGINSLETLLGLPKLAETKSVLSPTSKSLFLYLKITEKGVSRLTLTSYRSEINETCKKLLSHTGYLNNSSNILDSYAERSFVLCPYYRSEFGKKISEGVPVEEGEGLGPRKEMFHLLREGFERKFKAGKILKGGEGEKKDNFIRFGKGVEEIRVGWMLEMNTGLPSEFTRTVTRVNSGRGEIYLDKVLPEDFSGSVKILESCNPPMIWKKSCEKVWVNAQCGEEEDVRGDFRMMGVLMGLTVVNQCQMDFDLPEVFFKLLMSDKDNRMSKSDLKGFDDDMLRTLENVERGWSASQIKEVLEVEGVRVRGETDKVELYKQYENHLLDSIREGIDWQMKAIRSGFTSILDLDEIRSFGINAYDLKNIICGVPQSDSDDFDIREVFQVVTDNYLRKALNS